MQRTRQGRCVRLQTLLLVADQGLQGDGRLHLDRHLFVGDQVLLDQLHRVPQDQLIMELQWAERVQDPAGLRRDPGPNTSSGQTFLLEENSQQPMMDNKITIHTGLQG